MGEAMQCEEIREHLVELLYGEGSPVSQEIEDHFRTCLACRREFEELKQTRTHLRAWEDESPLRSVSIVSQQPGRSRNAWRYVRPGAIAAMLLVCFLALANTEITVNKNGFSFSTHLFSRSTPERDYYTKSEVRDILKRTSDESEEVNYLMMQKVLDTVDRDRWMDTHLLRTRATGMANRN
jgi:hypothetical protein